MRTRSNDFVVEGTGSSSPSVGGLLQEINNPDTVGEFRMTTNQFATEYGRAAGSVLSIVTKSGTISLHGAAYWRHNDHKLNSRSTLNKRVFPIAPWRIENPFAGALGGPVIKRTRRSSSVA